MSKSLQARSYREQCRKLGSNAEELQNAAKFACRRVFDEQSLLCLLKVLSNAHLYVSQALTLIDVHGMYSRTKKYVKIAMKASDRHKFKLERQYDQNVDITTQLWDLTELVRPESICLSINSSH